MNQGGGVIIILLMLLLAGCFVAVGFILGGHRVEVDTTVSIDFGGTNWQCDIGEIHQYDDNSVLGLYWPWDTWSVNVHGTLYGDMGNTYEGDLWLDSLNKLLPGGDSKTGRLVFRHVQPDHYSGTLDVYEVNRDSFFGIPLGENERIPVLTGVLFEVTVEET